VLNQARDVALHRVKILAKQLKIGICVHLCGHDGVVSHLREPLGRDDADAMIEDSRGEKIRKLLILGFAIRVRPEVVFFKIVRD
jgi:hypothetical protein